MASSEADCNKITDPGHVAYVLSFDGTKLLVNEANRNHDGQIHENETYTISNMDCMSFIHQPKSNNAEPPPDQPNQEPEQPQNFFQKIFRSISDWFKSLGK